MNTRNLPPNHDDALALLSNEINQLNGQVAGLIAFIQSLGFSGDQVQGDLVEKAHAILPPQIRPPGAFTVTDHASITLASLLSAD